MNFSDLNPQQRKIIEESGSVVIVNAGPGTGKTKTLISKIAYLLENKKVNSQNILALTFTKRAAGEMKDRLQNLSENISLEFLEVKTFHSWAYGFLQSLGEEITIISREDCDKLIRKIIKESKLKIPAKDLSLIISKSKNHISFGINTEMKKLIDIYNKNLLENDLLDYDDLLLKIYKILIESESQRKKLQNKYQYILIDEFQDTNNLQYQIIKLISDSLKNLFVIGDPLQSIYGFRGADKEVFDQLKLDFPKSVEYFLEINYRSANNIVEVSNLVFPSSANIKSHKKENGKVSLIKTLNEYSEADLIINLINEKIGGSNLINAKDNDNHTNFADFAVIYRTHGLSRVLEDRFKTSGFPFQIIKEDQSVEGDHIKLLSMHAAKGLEFKFVFICGFEEGLIPHQNAEDLEEEKRLLYVALTRAKEEAYLISAKKRNKKETQISQFRKLLESGFLEAIEDEATGKILKKIEKNKLKKSQMNLF